jgi:hypothetical protein
MKELKRRIWMKKEFIIILAFGLAILAISVVNLTSLT